MKDNEVREKLVKYIEENYNRLLSMAQFITKDQSAGDLLNDVLLYLLTRKNYSEKLKNCTNFFNYISRAMVIQYYSPNHQYDKLYRSKNTYDIDLNTLTTCDEVGYDTTYEDIIYFVKCSRLFKSRIKNYECKTLFLDYFDPEHNVSITGLTISEVKELRKTSYNKIANKYNISKSSVRNAIVETIDIVKVLYNKK